MAEKTRVLYLGPPDLSADELRGLLIVRLLEELGAEVEVAGDKLPANLGAFALGVSYRYWHKVPAGALAELPVANLHMGCLPHCRGCHPLFWAAADDVSIGATLHWMSAGIDTGPIIAQTRAEFAPEATLRQGYAALEGLMLGMLRAYWPELLARAPGRPQEGEGTFHLRSELPELPDGWDTTLEWVRDWGQKRRGK